MRVKRKYEILYEIRVEAMPRMKLFPSLIDLMNYN